MWPYVDARLQLGGHPQRVKAIIPYATTCNPTKRTRNVPFTRLSCSEVGCQIRCHQSKISRLWERERVAGSATETATSRHHWLRASDLVLAVQDEWYKIVQARIGRLISSMMLCCLSWCTWRDISIANQSSEDPSPKGLKLWVDW